MKLGRMHLYNTDQREIQDCFGHAPHNSSVEENIQRSNPVANSKSAI